LRVLHGSAAEFHDDHGRSSCALALTQEILAS
jgi:hypothetical protein